MLILWIISLLSFFTISGIYTSIKHKEALISLRCNAAAIIFFSSENLINRNKRICPRHHILHAFIGIQLFYAFQRNRFAFCPPLKRNTAEIWRRTLHRRARKHIVCDWVVASSALDLSQQGSSQTDGVSALSATVCAPLIPQTLHHADTRPDELSLTPFWGLQMSPPCVSSYTPEHRTHGSSAPAAIKTRENINTASLSANFPPSRSKPATN